MGRSILVTGLSAVLAVGMFLPAAQAAPRSNAVLGREAITTDMAGSPAWADDLGAPARSASVRGQEDYVRGGVSSHPSSKAVGLAIGRGFTCALNLSGRVKCWGTNESGELGTGRGRMNNPVPVTVPRVRRASSVTASPYGQSACALLKSGSVSCWGFNSNGQLGLKRSQVSKAVKVTGVRNARSVSAGGEFVCAALASGRVKCWGDNQWGQLGIGRKSPPKRLIRGWGGGIVGWPFPVPVRVPGIRTATAVSSGLEHACALLRGGTVSCWGVNEDDRLGRRTYLPAWVKPMLVPDVTTATSVSAGPDYTCAVMSAASVKCWGQNEFWEAGRPSEPDADRDVTSPVEVPGVVGVARIVANNRGGRGVMGEAGCGVTQNGGLLCWGGYEQEPLTVVSGPGVSAVASGSGHTCIVEMGAVKCWGSNSYGQLGVKGRYGKYFPTPVLVRGL